MPVPTDPSRPDAFPIGGRIAYLGFAALFCASGLLYSLYLGESLRYPDERDYIALARHLAALDGYSFDGVTPTAHRPPGYPAVLAPLVALVDSVHAARLLNFAALALAAHLLAGQIRAVSGTDRWQRSSLVLALIFAYPVLYYTAGTLFPQTVIALALTATLVLLQRRDDSLLVAAAIGALAAFTAEISPTTLVLLPCTLGFVLLSGHWSRSRVLVVGLAAALVFGGWFARNVVVLGEPILFSKNLAENLDNAVLNLEPLAPGESRPPAGAFDYALERLGQLVEAPGAYVGRVVDYFAWRNEMHVTEESSRARDLILFVTYHALLLGALLRLALAGRRLPLSPPEMLVFALYVGTALFHALLIPRIRYRIPFDFLLLLPVANVLLYGFDAARGRLAVGRRIRGEADTSPQR